MQVMPGKGDHEKVRLFRGFGDPPHAFNEQPGVGQHDPQGRPVPLGCLPPAKADVMTLEPEQPAEERAHCAGPDDLDLHASL
jgi:hypothetical protein